MTRTLQHIVFSASLLLLLLPACDRRSGRSHLDASNADAGAHDSSTPAAPNLLEDAAVSIDAGSGSAGADSAGAEAEGGRGGSGSGGSGQRAGAGGDPGAGRAGAMGSAGAGHAEPPIMNAGSDAGPSSPQGLCTSCGGCEETQKVVSTMHTAGPVTYMDPPPTSGPHNPCWARWGIHDEPEQAMRWVHNLEHGGVVFLYNCPDGCDAEVAIFKDIVSKRSRTILTAYADLPARFGVVSWGHRMVSDCMDQQAFLDFYAKNFDHGPESNANPPNPSCPP